MHHMARRQSNDDATAAKDAVPRPTRAQIPTVMWIGQGPVCVNIIDVPSRQAHDGVCRCDGCHASTPVDFGWEFF
jgi:hypothetical protein